MFEGITVTGMPHIVISRGEVMIEGDKFLGRPGRGQFVKRATYAGV
ncbi:MAG: hypothetical protein JOZ80_20270 [Acidobacteriaceae bacterium]|nr:hypothetical protein [Acidobacteriaceae bacterium]